MDKQVFWIILLLDVYCVYNVENMDNKLKQPKSQLSKERAKETCAQTGLVSYKTVKANPSAPGYLSQLVDGESAWVKGYAELSPFLTWHGCLNTTHKDIKREGLYARATEKKSLYLCSQQCLPDKYPFMGMKDKICYCFSHQQGHLIQYATVNDSLCSLPCDNNVVDSCGGHSFVSVYSIVEFGSMHWATNEPSKRQCVYVKRNGKNYDLHTASCHTFPPYMVNGFICMNSAYSRLETVNCTKANPYCIFDEPSTRQRAYMRCSSMHGKLANLGSESVIPQWITQNNLKYWIGIYRTFGISESRIENKTICLAAVRVNNSLYLEPDDCSEQKHYLCEVKGKTQSSHYPNTTPNTSPLTTDTKSNISPMTTDTKSYTSPITTDTISTISPIITDTKSNTIPIITVPITTGAISITTPGAGSVSPFAFIIPSILLVAFLVILVVFVLYRRRKKRVRQNNFTPDDTYTAIYETDNLENGQTVSAVSSVEGQNGDSKRLTAESTPNKSVRQTQRVKTEQLGDKKKKTGKEMQTEDYDKIDFKQPENVRKDAYEETNIYNHVLDPTDNHYDTTKAIKLVQSVGPCESDDTYSHMKGDVSTGDYCDLSVPGKKQDDRGKDTAVNYSYSKNVGQKDSSLSTDKHSRFVIVDDDSQDDMKNDDDAGEPTHPDEPITYTKISKVSAKN